MWQVTPTSSPQSEATADLVHRLRDDVLVDGEAALGSEIAVTGAGPGSVDAATFFGDRMPYFFVAVLILSFLLLLIVFRSVRVPLKAVLINLLSIGSASGLRVTLLQAAWFHYVTELAAVTIAADSPSRRF